MNPRLFALSRTAPSLLWPLLLRLTLVIAFVAVFGGVATPSERDEFAAASLTQETLPMFCSQCGTQNPDDSLRCTNCGTALRSAAALVESSALKGVLVLVVSFFTMPLRTVKIMVKLLREVGDRGALDTESSSVPHLVWLQTAGVLLVVLAMVGFGVFCLISAIAGLAARSAGTFFLMLFLAPLAMIAVNWVGMWIVESLSMSINVANDIRKIANR